MSQRLQDIDTKRLTQSLAPAKIDHIYRLLTRLFDQLEEGQSMPACLAHGDFTPWNLFLTTNGIAVYDWELAAVQPLAFDAFHFIVQAGILIQRKSAAEIHTQVKALLQHPQLGEWFADERQFVASWRMYLLHHISYYLLRYLRQVDLHEQVYWQLDAWVNLLEIEAAQPSTLPKLSSYE